MNMAFDKCGRAAQRLEFGNMTDPSTEEMPSDSQPSCDAQQAKLFSVYAAAFKRASETLNPDDERLADAAWWDFLLAYLPDEKQRSEIPVPALFRGRL